MSAEVDFGAGLQVSIGNLATEMELQRRHREELGAAVSFVKLPAFTFTASGDGVFTAGIPFANALMPKPGWAWAVQRITVAGGLATSTANGADLCTFYRGASAADIENQNVLQVVTADSPTWHPGRTGLVLQYGEMVLAGVYINTGNDGGQVCVSMDAIQVRADKLPYFLL